MTSTQEALTTFRTREQWVENLRVALIAGVIVAHTATAYVVDIPWYYDDEQSASGGWSIVLAFPTFAGGVFGLGPLFLIAGWFSATSLARRGPAAFARARLVRLGVPLLVFILLLQPLADYIGNLRSERGSFSHYLGMTEVGVMWFVAALLTFSLAYAALRRRPVSEPRPPEHPLTPVAVAAATIAVTSFVVWQIWPWNAEMFMNLRLGEWPQGAVLFALGAHAAETGWLERLSRTTIRLLGRLAVGAAVALAALFGREAVWGDVDVLLNATRVGPTVLFAALDGLIAVTWTLWCVAWFRRRWTERGPVSERASRGSYATYVIHPVVLTTIMVAFAAVALPPALKLVVVAALGVPACFALGYGLTRIPIVARFV
jgi:glucan biosynthesis protein C